MGSIYDVKFVNKAIELYRNGYSLDKLQIETGQCAGTWANIFKHKKVHKSNCGANYGTGDINLYKGLYTKGQSVAKISKKYKIERHFLAYLLNEDGLLRLNGAKYNYNIESFTTINNEASAYWLGFLYADGCISDKKNSVDLCLSHKDYAHVCAFRDWICPDAPVTMKKSYVNGQCYDANRVQVHSVTIVNDLIALGCIPRKTFKLRFPNDKQVPYAYIWHFMRGYWDGDGSVSGKNWSLAGTHEFLTAYLDVLSIIEVGNHKLTKVKNTYILNLGKTKTLIKLYNLFYTGASVYLKRKQLAFAARTKNYGKQSSNVTNNSRAT